MKRFLLVTIALLIAVNLKAENSFSLDKFDSTQLVVVTTSDWQVSSGSLLTFERIDGSWQQQSVAGEVSIGRTGLAWGRGVHPIVDQQFKVEGDGKAPAGIFELGDAFGSLETLATGLNYSQFDEGDFCIDVKGSPLYNQTVNVKDVGKKAIEGSTEPMRRDIHKGENLYNKGIFVKHNPDNIDGAGSCIFIHIWRGAGKPTAGCTAMDEQLIDNLLAWLDKRKQPLFVILPVSEYKKRREEWRLPMLL